MVEICRTQIESAAPRVEEKGDEPQPTGFYWASCGRFPTIHSNDPQEQMMEPFDDNGNPRPVDPFVQEVGAELAALLQQEISVMLGQAMRQIQEDFADFLDDCEV
jgi:hypothetical protein